MALAIVQISLVFTKFLANAASALPLITALGMIVGRRGNGRFCLWGAERVLVLCLFLVLSGPIYFLCLYFSQILPLAREGASLWRPLLEAAGMPYTTSILIWICGGIAVFLAQGALGPVLFAFKEPGDRYQIKHVRFPFTLCLLAAFAFFLTFISINWPFAGIPRDMGWDRVIMAVCRNGARHYFMAFCPAGALALLLAIHIFSGQNPASEKQKIQSIRWCAIWAAIGFLPYSLQTWGITLGVALHGRPPFPMLAGFYAQTLSLGLLTLAMLCWIFLAVFPRPSKLLAWGAALLCLLRDASPWLVSLCMKH